MNETISNEAAPPERAFLVGVKKRGETREWLHETLDELALLADTAGAVVVERFTQERTAPEPATYIGKGLVEQLAGFIAEQNIDLVIFDDDLTPAQAKNLETAWKTARVIDRTGLILDIFANRARTREAVVQVELAQLEYLLPRLTGQWQHLERQRGGIGMRGPGETQLETDKRIIREKIGSLKRMLEIIEQQREIRRKNRRNVYRIAIVGYTNAGKSTLLKALTGGEPFIENRLFATLDPLVRPLRLPNSAEPALLSDTVGFIRKLPHGLVASFRSTLSEAADADLLLHVADVSHPAVVDQMAEVQKVLVEIKADSVPQLLVLNKVDAITDQSVVAEIKKEYPDAVLISALRGHRLWELKELIAAKRAGTWNGSEATLTVEGSGAGVAAIYELGEMVSQEQLEDGRIKVVYRVPIQYQRKLEEILANHMWKPEKHKRKLPEGMTVESIPAKPQRRPYRREEESDRPPRRYSESSDRPYRPRREGEDRPYGGDRRPPREFNRDRDDRPPRGDRPSFGDRRPPFNRDRDDRPPRGDRPSFGDRRPPRDFDRRPPRDSRPDHGDRRPPFNRDRDDRPPRGDRPSFGDRRPPRDFDHRPPRDSRPDHGDRRPPFNRDRDDRPPRGDRPGFGDRRPPRDFDRRPPRDSRPENGERRPPFNRDRDDRPPRGDRPGFGDRRPPRDFDRRPSRDSRPDHGDRRPPFSRDRNDRPPRGDRPGFGDRRPPRDFDRRPPRDSRPEHGERRPPREARPDGDSRPPRGEGSYPKRTGGYGKPGSDRPAFKSAYWNDRPPSRSSGKPKKNRT